MSHHTLEDDPEDESTDDDQDGHPDDVGPLSRPDRGHLGELIVGLLIAGVLVAGLIIYLRAKHSALPVVASEAAQLSALQIEHQQLRQRHGDLVGALHQLPVRQIIVFGDTNNPIQWQRIR